MIEIDENQFLEKVVEKSKEIPVLVDFFAEWCPPCDMLRPFLEKLAIDFKNKVFFVKVDVDQNRILSSQYDIVSIPSIKLFKDGGVVDELNGTVPEQYLRSWLEKHLN